jgi:hypothetical protein
VPDLDLIVPRGDFLDRVGVVHAARDARQVRLVSAARGLVLGRVLGMVMDS